MRAQGRHVQVLREVRGQVLRQGHEEVQVRCEMRAKVRPQVRPEMRPEMRSQVRTEELMAGLRLLEIYAGLVERGAHLFGDLLGACTPQQWSHYPEDDAIDQGSGFQWFYHSHSPEDRSGACEHGHIHLFARRKLWARRLRSSRETQFAKLAGEPPTAKNTRHLLAIGFDAKGIPTTLFTVNSWVTGDRMLSAGLTAEILASMALDTGNESVDAVVQSLVRMYRDDIREMLVQRDKVLLSWQGNNVLSDENLELLSEVAISVDAKLASM